MKKILLITLLVALFACLFIVSASAVTDIGGLKYNLDATAGTATLTTDNKTIEVAEVVIPAYVTYEGVEYKVTMDKYAFQSNQNIVSVTIAGGVGIAQESFSGCKSLQTLVIGEGTSGIWNQKAFLNCSALKSVTLPSTLTSITSYTFQNCTLLEDITFPSGLTTIGERTFSDCTSLKSIDLPSTVTSVGKYAFYNCTSATSIKLSPNIKSFGDCAFSKCLSVETIDDGGSAYYTFENGALYSENKKTLYLYLATNEATSFKIPDTVTSVVMYAFSGSTALQEVEFGSAMQSISNYSFENCSSLVTVNFNEGFKTIGDYSFTNCTSLKNVAFPSTLTGMYNYTFKGCTALETIVIPQSLTVLNAGVFEGCTSLKNVTLHNKITKIQCFSGCVSLTSITIPSSVTYISSFSNCTGLTSIHIPASVAEIASNCFDGCTNLASITFEMENASLTKIGAHAFEDTPIREIVFPNSLLRIGQSCFSNCKNLESVNLGAGFTDFNAGNAGQPPFANGSTLKYIYLTDNFTAVRNNIFAWGDTNESNLKNNYYNLTFFYTGSLTQAQAIMTAAEGVNGFISSAKLISVADYQAAKEAGTLVEGTKGSPSRYFVYGYNKCDAFYESNHKVSTPVYTFDSYLTEAHMIGTCSQCNDQTISETFAPIVSFLGIAIKMDGTATTAGYALNDDSLAVYVSEGYTFNYGVVGYIPTAEQGNSYSPLTIGENGVEAIDKQYTIHADISGEYASVDFIIKGFPQEAVSLIMCMYIYDGTDIVYICGTSASSYEQVGTAYAVTVDVANGTIIKA